MSKELNTLKEHINSLKQLKSDIRAAIEARLEGVNGIIDAFVDNAEFLILQTGRAGHLTEIQRRNIVEANDGAVKEARAIDENLKKTYKFIETAILEIRSKMAGSFHAIEKKLSAITIREPIYCQCLFSEENVKKSISSGCSAKKGKGSVIHNRRSADHKLL